MNAPTIPSTDVSTTAKTPKAASNAFAAKAFDSTRWTGNRAPTWTNASRAKPIAPTPMAAEIWSAVTNASVIPGEKGQENAYDDDDDDDDDNENNNDDNDNIHIR